MLVFRLARHFSWSCALVALPVGLRSMDPLTGGLDWPINCPVKKRIASAEKHRCCVMASVHAAFNCVCACLRIARRSREINSKFAVLN